ncbi:MAG: hemerythrin domain-containing protein [Pseudomonadota bacterium]|nr:hemerythrin domain-containing protein [Pseudomonadota bacterium]
MPNLEWSDALALDMAAMDDTHREFVDLLALAEAATDETLQTHWRTLVEHTDDHFGREDQWMQATRFSSSNCHSMQHQIVLQVMREGIKLIDAGDLTTVRQMIRDLAVWFPQHAQSMDAALALHLRSVGFDPVTGLVSLPQALPDTVIHGCGGATCSDTQADKQSESAEAQAA